MEPRIIRPSLKIVWFWYLLAALAVLAGVILYATVPWFEDKPQWLMLLPLLLFIIPLKKHFATRLVKLTVDGERVTIDTGLLGRHSRTLDGSKIAEVCVKQSLWQRMIGVGSLSVQVAGEDDEQVLDAIDQPRAVADLILSVARRPR